MTAATRALRGTFRALEDRPYRWLWLGRLATSGTFHMNNVAQGWLVYHLTGSAFALGWVGAGWSVAMLSLGLFGGTLADRVDKRRLIFWMRGGMLLSALLLGLLAATGAIRVWHLAANSFLNGVFSAFLMPAQQSFISDVVDRDTLMNAISLDAVGMGLMAMVGASAAGLVIDAVGPWAVYAAIIALYAFSMYAIRRVPRVPPAAKTDRSAWADLLHGARYLRTQPLLALLLALEITRVFFTMPSQSLLPKFAQDNLHLSASGLGMLQSALGLGGLVASLVASNLGNLKRKGWLLATSSMVLGIMLVAMVTLPWLPAVLVTLVVIGGLGNLYMVLSGTLQLRYCDPAYRGRIVSMSMMAWALMPLSTMPSGAIADRVGVPWVVGVQGVLVLAIFGLVAWRRKELGEMA